MKHKFGILLIILGCGLLTAALALFLRNQQEQASAASASREAIAKVVEVIQEQKEASVSDLPAETPLPTDSREAPTDPAEREMTVVDIDGHGYIGFLGIPSLELELPVMADWTYAQLQIAPCRYSGSIFSNDLVIMAHNFAKHFGKLKDMRKGDIVTFTDMDGNTVKYQVAAREILGAKAVEEMTSGDYDLTLFTCTYGGENRIALRCDRFRNEKNTAKLP